MQKPVFGKKSEQHKRTIRITYTLLVALLTVFSGSFVGVLKIKEYTLTYERSQTEAPQPFPIGVNPIKKEITENPGVNIFFEADLTKSKTSQQLGWLGHLSAKLALYNWYQNLASPISRILVIESGERREQIAHNFGKILKWTPAQTEEFLSLVAATKPVIPEGKFFPGRYVVSKDATPDIVAQIVLERFKSEVLIRYTDEVAALVPLSEALTIASLLEREAYDFNDMRQIAGVIWNRLFIGMPLQIDATLQYAKGSRPYEKWWPQVVPRDKYIESPFNTYEHKGLPPQAISNPSAEAILATLNPTDSECMFYFHDSNGGFHCTATYEEHVALLKRYYGRGK